MSRIFDISSEHKNIQIDSKINHNLLKLVEKPARYIGCELNSVIKDPGSVKLRMALAFPDIYEIGMSHLGLKILYSIANSNTDVYAERVFSPWIDMEKLMREREIPLTTLETKTPLNRLDIIGFSLQYELCATNVLQMLDLSSVPILSGDRRQRDPFVIGGGPVCYNPGPLSRFFDAMVIGDGEEVIQEIIRAHIDWKSSCSERIELLKKWKQIEGVFVPSLHEPGEVVSKRIVTDLDSAVFPTELVTPICGIAHDRVGIEVARGCTRGCRFCQAGMIYRPVRERNLSTLMNIARKSLANTGWDEISLLSLSTGDYSGVSQLVKALSNEFTDSKVAISLPSLRTDTFDSELALQIQKVRKTGFTLAPEAGTDRLRRVINKGNTEEDLRSAVESAFRLGWQALKLYFMIGLPTETEDDLDGMAALISKASKWAKGGTLRASVSTFAPKAHTPFQWAQQMSMEETRRKQNYLRQALGKKASLLKYHDSKASFLEGVFARGDDRLGAVIQRAFDSGARFDGWGDQLKFEIWMDSFQSECIDPVQYLAERGLNAKLPWDHIDCGVTKDYLLTEWRNSLEEKPTEDCRKGSCSSCGVCDFDSVRPILAQESELTGPSEPKKSHANPVIDRRRFRIRFSKTKFMKYVGHHDISRAFYRALRKSGLSLAYSEGFHPHPLIRFSPPTAFGVQSEAELMDFETVNCSLKSEDIFNALKESLPNGLEPVSINETSLNEKTVSANIIDITYQIELKNLGAPQFVADKVKYFHDSDRLEAVSERKGRKRSRNLKEWVSDLIITQDSVRMTVKSGSTGSINPFEAIGAIFGIDPGSSRNIQVIKKSVTLGSG